MESEQIPYHVKYYKKNKKTISELKKIRYHSDPKYRERVKRRARERYQKIGKSPDKKLGYTVKFKEGLALYTVRFVLEVIGKSRDLLNNWEEKGLIPKSTYVDSRGWRLYTKAQIDALDIGFTNYDSGKWSRENVRDFLQSRWGE